MNILCKILFVVTVVRMAMACYRLIIGVSLLYEVLRFLSLCCDSGEDTGKGVLLVINGIELAE